MRKLASLVAVLPLLASCTATTDEEDVASSSESPLVSLTPQMCKTPNIESAPLADTKGRAINGTARTTLNGCIIGPKGATGASVISNAAQRLGDTSAFASMRGADDKLVFSRFTPRPANGTSQEIDVRLNVDHSPYARLRIIRQVLPDGRYWLNIMNVTAFSSDLAFFPITVIQPGKFRVDVVLRPETNGVGVSGTSEVTLEVAKENAAASAQLVRDVFNWLNGELD